MLKLKRKYSDTFELADSQINGCSNQHPFRFDNQKNQPAQQQSRNNKRRRVFVSQEEEQNRMDIQKYSGDVYSDYFPKPESMGLGSADQHASRENPRRERNVNLYTEEQVKRLLQMREREIRIQYDRILQEKLQEQFLNFTKFNQDYISRQFRSKNFDNSYIS